jgi:tetratricopeptide (TPR) repeat protein
VLGSAAVASAAGCAGETLVQPGDWRPLYTQSYVAAVREAQGDARGAAEAFAAAAKLSPDEPLWRVAEGEAWIDAGSVARGLGTLRAVAGAAVLDPTPRLRLAHAIWFATGDRAAAEREFALAAGFFPANWKVYDAWTDLLTVWDGPHAAAQRWEYAAGRIVEPELALVRAGRAWVDAGVPARALACWTRIREDVPDLRANIARVALDSGDLELALRYSSPTEPSIDGRRVYAEVLERRRRWAEAVAAWQAVLSLAPGHPAAHLRLGALYLLELDNPAEAKPHIEAAWERARARGTPDGALQQRAQLLRGQWSERTGDWPGAIAAYQATYRMNPTPAAAGRLGRAWWRGRSDAGAAIPLLEEAAPALDSPELWWCLAESRRAQRAWSKARSAYRSAAAAGRPQADVDAALATLPPE